MSTVHHLGPLAQFEVDSVRRIEIEGRVLAFARIGDDVYAIGDRCSHAEASLAEGEVDAGACTIECPKHGAAFSLTTGEPRTLPATKPVPVIVTVVCTAQCAASFFTTLSGAAQYICTGTNIAAGVTSAIVTGGIHFLLNDYAMPVTTPTLREWGIGDFGKEKFKVGEKDPIWMRAGTDILRAALANRDSTELKDVIIFRRDADGLLREQVYAKGAALEGGRWTLNGVTVYYRGNEKPDQMPTLVYSGSLRPAAAGTTSSTRAAIRSRASSATSTSAASLTCRIIIRCPRAR